MSETVAAIATAQAPGALGVVRISGADALKIADKVFCAASGKSLCDAKGYTMHYGHVTENGETVDEAVALVFRAPHSYTGEDVVELDCHGGLIVTRRVLDTVLRAGCRPAGPGEFTKRAFLNGRVSLTQAEAVMSVISAQGQSAARAGQAALGGKVARRIGEVTAALTHAAAALAAWTDYPEEDLPAVDGAEFSVALTDAAAKLDALLRESESGRAFTEGIPTAIVGSPNVGKSTLMNLLTGEESSIVTGVAGTTRDVVEETVSFAGVLLRLCDTAGLHQTRDEVERIGIERARARMKNAALLLAVFDQSKPLTPDDLALAKECAGRQGICVINKADLAPAWEPSALSSFFARTLCLSAKTGEGKEALESAVGELLGTAELDPAAGLLCTARQIDCARTARRAVGEALDTLREGMTLDAVGVCVDEAISALLSLTGERVSDTVVQEIFASFCVGK